MPQNVTERRHHTYAVVILLPAELDDLIMPLRERYDPLYNLVPAHITLVFPFESRAPLDELAIAVKSETDRYRPIPIQLHSIGDFYPQSPVIYWAVRPNPPLRDLYVRLNKGLGRPNPDQEWVPHVTVAREISNHRVVFVKEKIVPYLPDEEFLATSVDLISPIQNNRWVSVRSFRLAAMSM